MAQAIEDCLCRMFPPVPQRVNLSQDGLSFHAAEPITPGNYLHIAISNQVRNYHVAIIGRVVSSSARTNIWRVTGPLWPL